MSHALLLALLVLAACTAAPGDAPPPPPSPDATPPEGTDPAPLDPPPDPPPGPLPGALSEGLLSRPTGTSISITFLPDADTELSVEYGPAPGPTTLATAPSLHPAGRPFTIDLDGLPPGGAFVWRSVWRAPGGSEWATGPLRNFRTAPPPGVPFTFVIQADAHLDDRSSLELYERAQDNELADAPDLLVDLGDTFMCEKHEEAFTAVVSSAPDAATVEARYLADLRRFSRIAHSVPLFLVNGNHEGEAGWLRDGTAENLAIWTSRARRAYFAPPVPGGFYSGSEEEEEFVGRRDAHYAFTWGDALFVVLDPFWYTTRRPSREPWDFTLGRAQYDWLARTLEESHAPFRFVFVHNLVGGADSQARGGVEGAPFFEWGGADPDGTRAFERERPSWGVPIHQLLVDHHVTALFHGHDHVYVRQQLDGIVYQELPQPSVPGSEDGSVLAAEGHYASGTVLGSSGHLRVEVSPTEVAVSYVRAWRTSDENRRRTNGQVADRWVVGPR